MIACTRNMIVSISGGLLLTAMAVIQNSYGQDSFEKSTQEWRDKREAKLKADDGWLTVAGLFWLREGENDFGSDPSNDIVVPVKAAPGKIGTFVLSQGKVVLRTVEGVNVTANDKPVRELELKSDAVRPYDIVKVGDLSFILLKRGERFGIRLKDKNSQTRRDFPGLHWYPAKESYRVTARFIPYPQPKEVTILDVTGDLEKYQSPGLLKFNLNGQEYTLEPVLSDDKDKLFIIFRDLTSNKTTYPAGRLLYADLPKDNQVIVDFNQAYNPPCAFVSYTTCPLPPRQNRLNIAIEAGELLFRPKQTDQTEQASQTK